MRMIASKRRSSFGTNCVQCDNELIAPARSEFRDERQIRHFWHCRECDFCFEFGRLVSCRRQVNEGYQDGGRYIPVAVPVAARRIGQSKGSSRTPLPIFLVMPLSLTFAGLSACSPPPIADRVRHYGSPQSAYR